MHRKYGTFFFSLIMLMLFSCGRAVAATFNSDAIESAAQYQNYSTSIVLDGRPTGQYLTNSSDLFSFEVAEDSAAYVYIANRKPAPNDVNAEHASLRLQDAATRKAYYPIYDTRSDMMTHPTDDIGGIYPMVYSLPKGKYTVVASASSYYYRGTVEFSGDIKIATIPINSSSGNKFDIGKSLLGTNYNSGPNTISSKIRVDFNAFHAGTYDFKITHTFGIVFVDTGDREKDDMYSGKYTLFNAKTRQPVATEDITFLGILSGADPPKKFSVNLEPGSYYFEIESYQRDPKNAQDYHPARMAYLIESALRPVEYIVESVSLSPDVLTLTLGTVDVIGYFSATVVPADAVVPVSWSSSVPSVAIVDQYGKVTGLTEGTTTVTFTAGDKSDTAIVKVVLPQVQMMFMDPPSLLLKPKEVGYFSVNYIPDAAKPTFAWSSDNTKVATVDQNGRVTAIAEGLAVITAKADGKSASATVYVGEARVVITPASMELEVGKTGIFRARQEAPYVSMARFTWKSSDTSVATVDESGRVTALKAGRTTITASTTDPKTGAIITGSAALNVIPPEKPGEDKVESVHITPDTMTLQPKQSGYYSAAIVPATANAPIAWSSSNARVATIDQNGRVIAVAKGRATITASAGGKSDTATIIVDEDTARILVRPVNMTLEAGQTGVFTAAMDPANSGARFTWASSNSAVATVDGSGRVIARKAGITIISASSGGLTGYARLDVTEEKEAQPERVTIAPNPANVDIGKTLQLSASVSPAEADQSVAWKSLQPDIASVSSSGSVQGLKKGTAIVQATAGNGVSGICVVNVDGGGGDGRTNYYALLLGYDRAAGHNLSSYSAMNTDMAYMEHHLKTYTQFSSVTAKTNRKLNQTKNDIKLAFKKADADDVSLLYISGIGNRNKAGVCTLLTSDGQYWSMKSLRAWLDVIPGKVVVVLDLNYSGAFISKGEGALAAFNEDILSEFYAGGSGSRALNNKKYLVLTATSEREKSTFAYFSNLEGYMSVFTYELLVGIEGGNADASGDGRITLSEMYNYVNRRMSEWDVVTTIGVYPRGDASLLFALK